jgi:hypothetical protein
VFNEPHVELVTDPVVGLSDHGILSKNVVTGGKDERQVDVLIWGTGKRKRLCFGCPELTGPIGYKPEEFGVAVPTRGRKGELISDKYQPEMYSLYG